MDQKTGTLHLLFAGPPSSESSTVLDQFAKSNAIAIDNVKFSESTLLALQKRLLDSGAALKLSGVDVASTFIDTAVNRLHVDYRGAKAVEALQSLAGRDVDALVLNAATGSFDDDRDRRAGRLFGGLFISGGGCTAGYSNLRRNTSPYTTFGVSAGHCEASGGTVAMGFNWTSPGMGYLSTSPVIGSVTNNFDPGSGHVSDCDCMIFGPLPTAQQTSNVLVDNEQLFAYTGSSYLRLG